MNPKELEIIKAHGSSNDVIIINGNTEDVACGDPGDFIRKLCDREGPFGADGVYFVDRSVTPALVEYYNADGSFAEICGNGLRCVGRILLQESGSPAIDVQMRQGVRSTLQMTETSAGVVNVIVELPPVSFAPPEAPTVGRPMLTDEVVAELDSPLKFTALALPNPHLVSVMEIGQFDEDELKRIGLRCARGGFIEGGANVSFVVPLQKDEWFVRTYERGVGLTPSCGSATAAARVALTVSHGVDPAVPLQLRSVGGPASAWIATGEDGKLRPHISGNATIVYGASIPAGLIGRSGGESVHQVDVNIEDIIAYSGLYEENLDRIRSAGVSFSDES